MDGSQTQDDTGRQLEGTRKPYVLQYRYKVERCSTVGSSFLESATMAFGVVSYIELLATLLVGGILIGTGCVQGPAHAQPLSTLLS